MNSKGIRKVLAAMGFAVALGACGDLLTVANPQAYTDGDVDNALQAVADGAEGTVHRIMTTFSIYQALMADEYQHTGTWGGYDNVDHGWIEYGNSPDITGYLTGRRWYAEDSEERFKRVLGEAEAASSSMTTQVRLAAGMANLFNALWACESVAEPIGPMVPDMVMYQEAAAAFTKAIESAQASGRAEYGNAARAGRAVANQMVGDYTAAVADAAAVPDGFSYDAIFNDIAKNSVVQLTTKGWNEAAGLFYTLWPRIEKSDDPGAIKDPWTGMPDSRMPVYFDGEIATDNETPHYSQWKYNTEQSPIPMVHADEMRLIQAEAAASQNDYAGAMVFVNGLRAAVGLDPLPVPTSAEMMNQVLLSERRAELFMEGMRQVDLHRFDMVDDIFVPLNDNERPGIGRPTKFPTSRSEAQYNPNVVDDKSARCAPVSRAG